MASALKKFRLLEQQQGEEPTEKPPDPKPGKKNKLSLYGNLLSNFERNESTDEVRRRTARERLAEKRLKDKEKQEEEKRRHEEELELKRKQREEEERRQEKLREEEEERKKLEELKRKEAEEAERKHKEWLKKEGKYAHLKPAAAMFQRALDAKGSVQKSLSGGDRKAPVSALRKGTISEIRSKMFDQRGPDKSKSDSQLKAAPKKLIITSAEKEDSKQPKTPDFTVDPKTMDNNFKPLAMKPEVKDNTIKIDEKVSTLEEKKLDKPLVEQKPEDNKRQSFISDFAALEKTYKILGISKEPTVNRDEEAKKATSKKRHNSEGKIKNKDKVKAANRKSAAMSEVETDESNVKKEDTTKDESTKVAPKVDLVLKVQNQANRNFFQDRINEKKGLKISEPEPLRSRIRKKGSLTNAFEQNSVEEDKLRRQSQVVDDFRVDTKKFNSFLDKFESKEGREEAKAQMIKITNQQKEFERKKKVKEQEYREQLEAIKRKADEEQEKAIQSAIEEELKQQQIVEEENTKARIKAVEQEFANLEQEEDEAAAKRKVSKKKKKTKKDEEEVPLDVAPKTINLLAGDVSNTRSMFEKAKKGMDEVKEPSRPVRINKLTVNPFENFNSTEQTVEKIKVNKLQRNSFMDQLEKKDNVPHDIKKHIPVKKISGEACIKFESKKERKPSEQQDGAITERKCEVRVSKSIEGQRHHDKAKEKKTGSSMSLHKIFIDGPKEFFKSSKEKLYKLSKETLCEVSEITDKKEAQNADKKPSRSEMQNYLLSHVLFDGKEVTKKEKNTPIKEEIEDIDDVENYLDDEYRHKIEQYCALLEDDKPKRKKKKKTTKTKKLEERLPTLKTNDIKAIQEQLQLHGLGKPADIKMTKGNDTVFDKHESQVNKFKGMFDNDPKEDGEKKPMLGQSDRRTQRNKSDIFSKIKALENAEKERLERERENEDRIQYLLQKEIERQKEIETQEKNVEETDEEQVEEELKHNILQCLEDEVENLEQEMLALDTQEQMIIDEEMEDLMDQCEENENEVEEHKTQLHEIHEEIVERKKHAADKKRKVLERFQHVLDANDDEDDRSSGKKVGKLQDRMNIFNSKTDNQNKKSFEDNVFVGISDVMSRVKDRFEQQEEKQNYLLSKDDIKRPMTNPAALKYEMLANEEEPSGPLSPAPRKTEWSWKNKTAAELDTELNSYNETESKESPPEKKPSRNYQETKFSELLSETQRIRERLNEKDLERENERKIQEMEELIDGVKESLKQHEEQFFQGQEEEEDYKEPEQVQQKKKFSKKKPTVDKIILDTPKANTIISLKNQLLTKEEVSEKSIPKDIADVDVSVSMLRNKIIAQSLESEQACDELEQRSAKRSVSSNIVSKLSDILPNDDREDELQLRKAPKMVLKTSPIEDNEAPAKTLEDLKAEKESKKWAWKEKDMADLHNFINANNDIAPKDIVSQQKNLKDLQDEENVVESLHGFKDAAILEQIREEKEREFNEFMSGVKSYMKKDTKTAQEEEFKEGMKSYLDLIDSDRKTAEEEEKKPQIKLSTISKLKSTLLEGPSEVGKEKRINHKVSKLQTSKIEAALQQNDSPKQSQHKDNVIPSDQTLLVKSMFEMKENSPNKSPLPEKKSVARSTFAEKFAKRAHDEKLRRLEHQFQYKQKTINDLHSYIENNEMLGTNALILSLRESKIRREDQKLVFHEAFYDNLILFLKEPFKSDEQNIFMGNIRAYLTVLDNVESTYNATPKLRKHPGQTSNQSNMRRAIIEKSVERSKHVDASKEHKEEKKNLSADEKRKEICAKYGIKDRRAMEVEDISEPDDDLSMEEVDVKDLTDKELCEKYQLPYVPDSSELYSRDRSDSASSFTGLLSKMRLARQSTSEKAMSTTKKIFEKEEMSTPTEMIKSPTVKLRKRFDSECEETSRGSSPLPTSYDPGSRMTDKIKRRFEDQRSSLVDDEVDAINTFAQRNGIIKSGSTTKMKRLFESGSPNNDRSSSPLIRTDRGSLVNSRLKMRFEGGTPGSNRQSYIDDDSDASSRGCSPMLRAEPGSIMTSKMRNRFESGAISPTPEVKPAFNRGVQKSSTVGDIGFLLQNNKSDAQQVKTNLAAMYFKQDKATDKERNVPMSPALHRAQAIEKSKSFSKFKNAFESGKGLNNDSSDDDDSVADQKTGVSAELAALRASAQSKSNIDIAKSAVVDDVEKKKRDLAASFFKGDKPSVSALRSQGPVRSTTVSDIGSFFKASPVESAKSVPSPKLQAKILPSVKDAKTTEFPKSSLQSQGPVRSTTVSDIGIYLQESGKSGPSPKLEAKITSDIKDTKVAQSPQLGLQHSKSFSKFKNAFEDGKGIMDESEKPSQTVDNSQKRVMAEITALKSSSKIQNMFRINKSKLSPTPGSPQTERRKSIIETDLDDDTMIDVAKSRSAISNMFESQGPKMTFGGAKKLEPPPSEPLRPKSVPKKKEEENINERKWVFDTIQKYFDVIVEEEQEDEEEEEEDEEEEGEDDGDEGDEDNAEDDSESDYTDAEDELPEIDLPPVRERSGTLPSFTPLSTKPKELPKLNLPVPSVQRTSSLRLSCHAMRASTASPATVPVRKASQPERKMSTLSIDECIDDAAKKFDQLTDGSDLSLDQSPSLRRAANRGVQKSSSSTRIRSMLQSVVAGGKSVQGSNTSIDMAAFKTNLREHLVNSRQGSRSTSVAPRNLEPGVGNDSSSDYSEYD